MSTQLNKTASFDSASQPPSTPSTSSIPHHTITSKTNIDDSSTPVEHIKVIDKQSLEYVIKTGISGGIAGCAAKTLIAPLDRIKILFQTSNPEFLKYSGTFTGLFKAGKNIYLHDGIFGLFQGHSATLLRIFPYAATKFVAYEQFRTILIPSDTYETAGRRFLAGSLSGLASVFLTYPLDLIRVRLAFETKQNYGPTSKSASPAHHQFARGKFMGTIQSILKENPPITQTDARLVHHIRSILPAQLSSLTNFYRGFTPTILGMIPYAGVSFYTHDLIQDIFRSPKFSNYTIQASSSASSILKPSKSRDSKSTSHDSRKPLKAWAQLIAGGLAGMCSQTAAYPFEVIRRRMQVGGAINDGEFIGFKRVISMIYAERGMKGFFIGLSIGYAKVIPMVACSFYVYERAKSWFRI